MRTSLPDGNETARISITVFAVETTTNTANDRHCTVAYHMGVAFGNRNRTIKCNSWIAKVGANVGRVAIAWRWLVVEEYDSVTDVCRKGLLISKSVRISYMHCLQMAKTAFQQQQNPLDAALFYLALRKKNVLTHLFRSVRDERLSEFFAQDFTQERWRKAALKNAFLLMSKQRFHHAAAFFLLGESLNDAVQVNILIICYYKE